MKKTANSLLILGVFLGTFSVSSHFSAATADTYTCLPADQVTFKRGTGIHEDTWTSNTPSTEIGSKVSWVAMKIKDVTSQPKVDDKVPVRSKFTESIAPYYAFTCSYAIKSPAGSGKKHIMIHLSGAHYASCTPNSDETVITCTK